VLKFRKFLGIIAFIAIIGVILVTCDVPLVETPNKIPVESDYIIGNLNQIAGNVTTVTIIANNGKSPGLVNNIRYNGSTTIPQTEGTYSITFDVAAAKGWDAVSGLAGGTLNVNAKIHAQTPNITSHPESSTVIFNALHDLSVEASVTDGGTLTYRWYANESESNIDGTHIVNATTNSFNPHTGTAGTHYYFVEVINTIEDNGDGGNKTALIRSNVITLTVDTQVHAQIPNITNHPSNAIVTFNAPHSLSVAAIVTDGGKLTYQWYNNINASNTGGTAISGATDTIYNPSTSTDGIFYYFVEITNSIEDNGDGGIKIISERSNVITLTVNEKVNAQTPIIITQPIGNTVIFNGNHLLSVTANSPDGGTLSYQWYSNTIASDIGGAPIVGATLASYNPPTGSAGTYYYYVEVKNTIVDNGDSGNKIATAKSNAVILIVKARVNAQAPNITGQPTGGTVIFGGTHNLTVTAVSPDSGTLTYQWYSNTSSSTTGGSIINNATSAAYNPPTNTAGTFYYFVQVTNTITNNGDGGTKTATARSNAVTLTVNSRVNAQTPNITGQPTGGTVIFGGTHNLTVAATSPDNGTLTYQWYSNTSSSTTGGSIIGSATSATYNPPTNTAGTFYYFVQVTNTITNNGDGGTKTATARSNAVTLTVNSRVNAQAPNITGQPTGGTVIFGGTHNLTITAVSPDSGTLTYQWYSNTSASNTGGSIISSATSATYNPPTNTAGTFYYFVQVTNTIINNGDGGTKTATARSNVVTLTVNARVNAQIPNITGQPTGVTIIFGGTHNLTVTAVSPDSGTLTYQWYSNTSASNIGGSVISSATSAAYNPPTNTTGTFYYFVQVTNTIANNGDGGTKTATARSSVVEIQIVETTIITINLDAMNEWDLIEQAVQINANTTNIFTVIGNYSTYRWYLDGISVGTSSSYSFNKSAGVYQLIVVVTNSFGESRSGRCRVTVSSTANIGAIFSEDFEGATHLFTIVNGTQTNQWHVGTVVANSGTKSAYISNNNGTSNAYTITSTSIVHMYRDVTFPISTEPYTLTFNWRAQGEGTSTLYDYLRIRLVDTTTSVIAGNQPTTGTVLGTYNLGGTGWNQATINIPVSNSGTTRRLLFTWVNDNSQGTQPPAAIDNIIITK